MAQNGSLGRVAFMTGHDDDVVLDPRVASELGRASASRTSKWKGMQSDLAIVEVVRTSYPQLQVETVQTVEQLLATKAEVVVIISYKTQMSFAWYSAFFAALRALEMRGTTVSLGRLQGDHLVQGAVHEAAPGGRSPVVPHRVPRALGMRRRRRQHLDALSRRRVPDDSADKHRPAAPAASVGTGRRDSDGGGAKACRSVALPISSRHEALECRRRIRCRLLGGGRAAHVRGHLGRAGGEHQGWKGRLHARWRRVGGEAEMPTCSALLRRPRPPQPLRPPRLACTPPPLPPSVPARQCPVWCTAGDRAS